MAWNICKSSKCSKEQNHLLKQASIIKTKVAATGEVTVASVFLITCASEHTDKTQ